MGADRFEITSAASEQRLARRIVMTVALLLVAVVVLAVGLKFRRDAGDARDQAKSENKAAALAAQDYAYAQRHEFVAAMKRDLAEIQDEMDMLSGRVDRSRGAAKVEAKKRLEEVRQKLDQARQRLIAAQEASESTWNDVKNGFRHSHNELMDSFTKTRQWLSDKIEP